MRSIARTNSSPGRDHLFNDCIALALCVISTFLWIHVLIDKFAYFGYYDWDLALYANAMWNLAQGSLHSSLFGANFLTNHAEYLSFVLAPLYGFFAHPFFLIVLKLLSLTAGSYVLYLVARKDLNAPIAMLLMLLYQLYPANLFMLIYEFHFENLAILPLFLMYHFFRDQKLVPFLVTAFFASLIKENIALVVATFGIYAIFTAREKKFWWVTGPLFFGGGIFFLSMFIITPYLRASANLNLVNQYVGLYWINGGKDVPLAQAMLLNFKNAWAHMTGPVNFAFIKELFGPLNFLPLLSPHVLFLAAPVILQNFLSPAYQMHTIYYHYAATITIFIFLAMVASLKFLKARVRYLTFCVIILLTGLSCIVNMINHLPEFTSRTAQWPDRLDPARWEMVSAVPPEASVVATFDFLDKLANRKDIYSFHNVWRGNNPFTGESPYRLPRNVSLALIDWECPWFWGDVFPYETDRSQAVLKRSSDFYFSEDWRVKKAAEGIVLLEKGGGDQLPSLLEVSRTTMTEVFLDPPVSIDGRFSLLAMGQPDDSAKTTVPLTFFWRADQDISDLYGLVITLKKQGEPIFRWYHHPGYGAYATPLWKKGEYIKERYWMLLPVLFPGEYTIFISLANMTTRQEAQLTYQGQRGKTVSVVTFRVDPGKAAPQNFLEIGQGEPRHFLLKKEMRKNDGRLSEE